MKKILGFTPIYELEKGTIATAALIICQKCALPIRSMGGPNFNAWCISCTDDEIDLLREKPV